MQKQQEVLPSVTSLTFSVTSDHKIHLAIIEILGIFTVKIRNYAVKTIEFAVAQRLIQAKTTSEGENPAKSGNLRKNCGVICFPKESKY
jgi:hypothetical protein